MPADYKMTWIASRAQWAKKYKRKQYIVSCRALQEAGFRCDSTKLGSREAANQWWAAKKLDLDMNGRKISHETGREMILDEVDENGIEWHSDSQGGIYRSGRLQNCS